jgi:hypothetical protein
MKRRYLCIVVALLSLLAFARSAHAECAWVLWAERWGATPKGVDFYVVKEWKLLRAHESKGRCDENAAERAAAIIRGVPNATSAGENNVLVREGSKGTFTFFKCLPDTIDPRGPKGK